MISVRDLIEWANKNAIGRSYLYPQGWIHGDKLKKLGELVKDQEPFAFDLEQKQEEKNICPCIDCTHYILCSECEEYKEWKKKGERRT